jgi:hypothetical protein
MKRIIGYGACFFLILLNSLPFASAQVAKGIPLFNSFGGGPFDSVNLGNLNVHFAVPVIHKAGRGTDFDYKLAYDSSIWVPVVSSGHQSWQPVSNWGWTGSSAGFTGYLTYTVFSGIPCYVDNTYATIFTNWVYYDTLGTSHSYGSNNPVYNDARVDQIRPR